MQPSRVETIDELTDVWRLTYDEFLRTGLIKPQTSRELAHYKHLDLAPDGRLYPETVVHTVAEQVEIVGTVSVTLDGPAGLHTDGEFHEETEAIRRECAPRQFCLACSWRIVTSGHRGSDWGVIVPLLDAVYQDCLERGVDVVLALFHPRHVRFYRRVWGFETVAGPKPESSVGNSPAVLMRANMNDELAWVRYRKRLIGEA